MNNRPLVTVGIPTFNRKEMLENAIHSVLQQTYDHIEIVISDNASTDGTESFLKSLEISVPIKILLQNENIGMRANWNACLNAANGDYFILLSDDDLIMSTAIESLVQACLTSTNLGFCYGRVCYFGRNLVHSFSAPAIEAGTDWLTEYAYGKRETFPSATLFPVALAQQLGGYPDVGNSTDFALLVRLTKGKSIIFVDELVCQYRAHEGALSNQNSMIDSIISQVNWLKSEHWLLDEIKQKIETNYQWYIATWIYQRRFEGEIEKSKAAYLSLLKLQPNFFVKAFLVPRNSKLFVKLLKTLVKVKRLILDRRQKKIFKNFVK